MTRSIAFPSTCPFRADAAIAICKPALIKDSKRKIWLRAGFRATTNPIGNPVQYRYQTTSGGVGHGRHCRVLRHQARGFLAGSGRSMRTFRFFQVTFASQSTQRRPGKGRRLIVRRHANVPYFAGYAFCGVPPCPFSMRRTRSARGRPTQARKDRCPFSLERIRKHAPGWRTVWKGRISEPVTHAYHPSTRD